MASATPPLPTTLEDFFQGGSQPDGGYDQLLSSINCGTCHGTGDVTIHVMTRWQGSMMAQAARDPLFYACLAIAEQDAAFVGDICIRCHVPRAWISGRSSPSNGSAINQSDRDAINCHFCHRLVDPFYEPGVSPIEDLEILNSIKVLPVTIGGGNYVLDRLDRRRGKRPDAAPPHSMLVSPFHESAELCATCHDVSNPVFTRQPDGSYVLNDLNQRHPTGNKYDQFPLERTFSEWLHSDYARVGVNTGGRFGGNRPVVSTCQDCHMPDTDSRSCSLPPSPVRHDMASHDLVGGNAWVPDMVANLYPGEVNVAALQAGKARAISMLQRAATLGVTQSGDEITVRVTNETGHKLPSGYPEGRRMWINVRFFDAGQSLIAERGYYDPATAVLTTADTRVYQIKLGVDEAVAAATGLPVGPTFHFAVVNKVYKDNRIPARGFTNAAYLQIQSEPVAAYFADGQYWDDTPFALPPDAARAEIRLWYQTSSKEYVTFLRDENVTNNAGQVLYDQWLATGKSPPVEMAVGAIDMSPFAFGDFDGDRMVTASDFAAFVGCMNGPDIGPPSTPCEPGDLQGDSDVDLADLARFQRRFGT